MSNGSKTTGNEFKLLLNFYRWGQPRYYDKVQHIVTSLTTEPLLTLVPAPWLPPYPSRATLKSAFQKYEAAMLLANTGLKWAITGRDNKRAVLQDLLVRVAVHLELAAKDANDLSLLERTGFDRQRPIVRHPITGTLPAPAFRVQQGPLSGTLRGDTKRLGPDITYEGQLATGDRTVNANYKTIVVSTRARGILFPGLTPGQLYHLRLRAHGRKGPSPWSQIISRYAT